MLLLLPLGPGAAFVHQTNRGCYEREGVPADEQYSKVPEKDEKGVK